MYNSIYAICIFGCLLPIVKSPPTTMYLTFFTLLLTPANPPFPLVTTVLFSVSMSFCLSVLFLHSLPSVLYPTWVQSHGSWHFLSDLFLFMWYFRGPSMLLQVAVFHLFLWLSSIPLNICTTPFLSKNIFRNRRCMAYFMVGGWEEEMTSEEKPVKGSHHDPGRSGSGLKEGTAMRMERLVSVETHARGGIKTNQ